MAETLHPSTVVHASKQVERKETLVRSLDDLLERYLHLLNQYQTLQQSLAQHFSRGYLSLAQANFSNPNRVRYGQDHYDDRMQASARVFTSQSTPSFSTQEPKAQESVLGSDDDDDEVDTAKESTVMDNTQLFSEDAESGSNMTRDPLNWFGILVPPALRTSQSNFKDAVADLIPALASISKEMSEVEIEIRRARKRIRKAV